jgi:glycosyltransferase involved in cell wall biosynthesis
MKILFVTTISNTVNAFLIPHIKMLMEHGHQVDVAFNIDQVVKPDIEKIGCKVHIIPFQRSPLRKENYLAYKQLKKLISDENYDIVHTHTPVASAIVRLACRHLKNVEVFYTAHGFHFFKGAAIKNWLIYYPIEKWLSKYTDVLITINKEDYQRAKKSFKAGRVEYIPGIGLDTNKFINAKIDKSEKRKELDLPEDAFVVLSVGELNKNKNHEIVIKALAKLNNFKIYYVICGQGPLEQYLIEVANKVGLDNRVKLLGFRSDIAEICKAADIFAFPSSREGLPVSLMEAMAAGLPVVCSNTRGNTDLIEDGKGGYLVEPDDVEGFAYSIKEIANSALLREKMSIENKSTIKKFDISNVLLGMINIYNESMERG